MPAGRHRKGKRTFFRRTGRKRNLAGGKRVTRRSGRSTARSGQSRGGGLAARNRAENEAVEKKISDAVLVEPNVVMDGKDRFPDPEPRPEAAAPENASVPALSEAEKAEVFDEGYRKGLFDGGEARLGRQIPRCMILPEITLDEVIGVGLRHLSSFLVPLMNSAAVHQEITNALSCRKPYSLVRLGDGELLTLAHDTVLPAEQVKREGSFLPYAGVNLPDHIGRDALAETLRHASLIGVPESRHPFFQGLLFPVLRHYHLDYRKLRLTSSTINYSLNEEGRLRQLMTGRRLLLIGNEAPGLAVWLAARGFFVAGAVAPVDGIYGVDFAMKQAAKIDFDLALVSAGIAAVILCTRIASELGKVALDFGHLANKLISGEMALG
ncbi:GT-D fold domain-containing glycosyltransferase [Fontibacillus sp. BL9]|uniref:GT-D fold domain-containing protein n=1 Tax=Fontibacillus sp. BL9 TaxID=3389971 RepID=UPI00397CB59B